MFEAFKRTTPVTKTTHSSSPEHIFFILDSDATGSYVSVYDESSKEPSFPDPSQFHGALRNALERIHTLSVQQEHTISWGNEEDGAAYKVYIAHYPQFLDLLKEGLQVVNKEFRPLTFASGIEPVSLIIEPASNTTDMLQAHLSVADNEPVTSVLTEQAILSGTTVYSVLPLGSACQYLLQFNTTMPAGFVTKFLSLLISHISNVHIVYQDFQIRPAEPLQTQPVLLIDRIGQDDALHLRLSQAGGGLDADFLANYEITSLARFFEQEKLITLHEIRDDAVRQAHQDFLTLLRTYERSLHKKNTVMIEGPLIRIPADIARIMLEKELGNLLQTFRVFGSEHLRKYRIRAAMPKLHVSLTDGIDFLAGSAALQVEGEQFKLFDAVQLYKTNSYIPLSNGDKAIINPEYMKKLSRLFRQEKDRSVKVSFFDLPFIEELIDETTSRQWQKSRSVFTGFAELPKRTLTLPKLGVTLRDYQVEGVKWMQYLYETGLNGCLADDMGLGKTIQAIGLLSLLKNQKKPSLIVVPKSLLFNWQREVARMNKRLSLYTYYQTERDIQAAKKHKLVLTTYQTLRSDVEQLRLVEFDTVILDESSTIKNPDAQISKAVSIINAEHRFALSGTPIENNISELFSLFRFLEPSMFGSQQDFLQKYLYPIQREHDTTALEELRKKLYPFLLRRTKQQVLKSLPEKVEQTIFVDLSPEQAALYESRRKYYYDTVRQQMETHGITKSQLFIFQALSELRQLVSCPEEKTDGAVVSSKRELLKEQLQEAFANNHKVLIFTQYLGSLEAIAADVESLGIDCVTLSGSTTHREKLVDQFTNDPNCKAFIATLKTGGVGLNLTVADMVFIYDPWWNKAAENQAIDRTHRMGQKNTVFAYKLIARGTLEEKILQLQERKAKLFSQLMQADASAIKALREEDIDFLLQ